MENNEENLEQKLSKFLSLYWLRPENGLITTFKSKAIENLEIRSPSLDISCGDGMYMAIHLGAEFEFSFDFFKSTRAKDFSHSNFIDIFDTIDNDYEVNFIKKSNIQFDYGIDWKQKLLDKAQKTEIYKNLILHDNNITPLPFEDDFFMTIHSNSVYWINEPEKLISEIYRITKPGGNVSLELLTPHRYETLIKLEKYLNDEAIGILDRKRRANTTGMREYGEWKNMLENAGFKIKQVESVYPDKIIMDIWNIGFRPIAHLLIQMADSVDPNEKLRIKKEWVDIFLKIFRPLLNLKTSYSLTNAPYLSFLLEK